MKYHFIFVEKDGSVRWSGNVRRLHRHEGEVLDREQVVTLGPSTWKLEVKDGTTTVKLRKKDGNVTIKELKPGCLYKIKPQRVTTLVTQATRGTHGFESVSSSGLVTAAA